MLDSFYRRIRTFMPSALASAAFIGATLASSSAGATFMCTTGHGCMWLPISMEDCNLLTGSNPDVVCFFLSTAGGGPVLQRGTGTATLLMGGQSFPVVVSDTRGAKAIQSILKQGKGGKIDAAAARKAMDAAFRSASPKVNDNLANAAAEQFKARVEVVK